jgi:hypothetical protein
MNLTTREKARVFPVESYRSGGREHLDLKSAK